MELRPETPRTQRWASTMGGHAGSQARTRRAHEGMANSLGLDPGEPRYGGYDRRARREDAESTMLAPGATRSSGAGNRGVEEEPDPERTCFERDRDRILHASAFRRLAGKTQVFVFPEDHQRTRLTHALEVAQVATAIARAVHANVALTEAIALGHDCGHGPGGHASEDAFSPYVDGGYDHAVWGADVVLAPLNLCVETLDGIRNHSWSRPVPSTCEGEIVSWADRIAYVCHDMEDASHAGIVSDAMLPAIVRERCGDRRSAQLRAFIGGVVDAVRDSGSITMVESMAEALEAFRGFNYEHIYMRPASLAQSASVIRILRALVEHHTEHPTVLDEPDPIRTAVTQVAGMTDRYAFTEAKARLGWQAADLPVGI